MNYLQPTLYDNVFDEPTMEELGSRYLTWFQSGWHSNKSVSYDHGHMQHYIARPIKYMPVDVSMLPHMRRQHESLMFVWDQIKSVLGDRGLYRVYSKSYHFGMDAYKHNDIQAKRFVNGEGEPLHGDGFETCILYMNQEWDTDYYGQTVLYTDDDEIDMSVIPKHNRLFIFDSAQNHSTTPLSRHCPVEKQIIVFNSMPAKAIDNGVKYLIENTADVRHFQGTSFFEHLWRVFNTLQSFGNRRALCIAGLWHAVYGTTAFDNPTKGRFPEDLVKDFIGDEAEELVARFCGLPQPRVDAICEMKDLDLAWIEVANLLDQNPDGRQNEKLSRLNLLIDDLKNE